MMNKDNFKGKTFAEILGSAKVHMKYQCDIDMHLGLISSGSVEFIEYGLWTIVKHWNPDCVIVFYDGKATDMWDVYELHDVFLFQDIVVSYGHETIDLHQLPSGLHTSRHTR